MIPERLEGSKVFMLPLLRCRERTDGGLEDFVVVVVVFCTQLYTYIL